MAVRVGVDVGGTFTKAVACDVADGRIVARSIIPTTHNAANGVAAGVASALEAVAADVEAAGLGPIALVTHSTTQAVNALLAGVCKYAVVWRAMHNPRGTYQNLPGAYAQGATQFTAPYGFGGPGQGMAVAYTRWLERHNQSREKMATLALTQRRHTQHNPHAYFYGTPLTREDYLSSRMVAYPFCLFDCDIPVQGAIEPGLGKPFALIREQVKRLPGLDMNRFGRATQCLRLTELHPAGFQCDDDTCKRSDFLTSLQAEAHGSIASPFSPYVHGRPCHPFTVHATFERARTYVFERDRRTLHGRLLGSGRRVRPQRQQQADRNAEQNSPKCTHGGRHSHFPPDSGASAAARRLLARTLAIAAIVFQLRVVAATPKTRSSAPR